MNQKALALGRRGWPALLSLVWITAIAGITVSAASDMNLAALRAAIMDLTASFPEQYAQGPAFLRRVEALEKQWSTSSDQEREGRLLAEYQALQREALLANPLLDFNQLLLVKRKSNALGLPQNWQGNCALSPNGYDNEIAILSPVSPSGSLQTRFQPKASRFVGDVDLHFDGDRLLFSMPDAKNRWAIWEVKTDGSSLRQISPANEPDVDWYDACYLADGRIIFGGTACFQGVPCVGGGNRVANLYLLEPATGKIRQLTFDQDHDWCPTLLNNGRVLYSRWEYSDSPHYFTRLLFSMNPDGTEQVEFYGSNSYWPNSIFYARPIPGHPTKVIAIISGHHGVPRMGELVVFDPGLGRHESSGAIQRIPGHQKTVPPTIRDDLVEGSWPKFLHPYPLSEKYFLVSAQLTPRSEWSLYLADVFDNLVLIKTAPGYALLEPIPLRKTLVPPIIPDKVNLAQSEATVFLQDVYAGPGLQGVPRGTVKKLRVYELHYTYPQMGGHIHIGIDGPWDVHRIWGTVQIHEDGSALFRVPANRPLAVQPLDAEGKALQVMRSWFTAMPGETLSCVGCHEKQNTTPLPRTTLASTAPPQRIEPWYGPARGFSFTREVQPVLDRFCVGCHNADAQKPGKTIPNFADITKGPRNFTQSYLALHPYVRRPGPESDYHLQHPGEWHAETSQLIQMLKKGHHGVTLDAEAWDRLITWIDLNVPDHGTWSEHHPIPGNYHQRRLQTLAQYANRSDDPEQYPVPAPPRPAFVLPAQPAPRMTPLPVAKDWPCSAESAKQRQTTVPVPTQLKVALSDRVNLELNLIPSGEFVMGSLEGDPDEYPPALVRIEHPFYMGIFEVSNEQFGVFDSQHDSGYISVFNKDQNTRGEPVNRPRGPVLRVSWQQALAFCQWLSQKTGRRFSLPTEAQWEYACRAGTDTPWSFGADKMVFGQFANLADLKLNDLCRGDSPRWIPSLPTVNDGAVVVNQVGRYQPNPWGLRDMHGNAAEWTLTTYQPYPYLADHRDDPSPEGYKVVRGGSFYDRPERARSSFRLRYPSWQRIFNVGFRVVCEADTQVALE